MVEKAREGADTLAELGRREADSFGVAGFFQGLCKVEEEVVGCEVEGFDGFTYPAKFGVWDNENLFLHGVHYS